MKTLRYVMRIRKNSGFTLVEVMFSVAILLIVSGGIYSVFAAGEDTWQVNRTQIGLQQDLRRAMDGMIFDLRHASTGSIVNVPANDTAYTTITFRKPNAVTAGSLQWNGTDTVFALSGGQLQKVEGLTTQILANDINTVTFRRTSADPETLLVALTAQRSTLNGRAVNYALDFEVQLRN